MSDFIVSTREDIGTAFSVPAREAVPGHTCVIPGFGRGCPLPNSRNTSLSADMYSCTPPFSSEETEIEKIRPWPGVQSNPLNGSASGRAKS